MSEEMLISASGDQSFFSSVVESTLSLLTSTAVSLQGGGKISAMDWEEPGEKWLRLPFFLELLKTMLHSEDYLALWVNILTRYHKIKSIGSRLDEPEPSSENRAWL